jgi:hypothetical protein
MPAADAAIVSVLDAGVVDASDAGAKREKLPAPEAGVEAPAADASDGATVVDAGVETVGARAPVAGDLVITEALVNPAGTDTGREWIEIASLADEPLDLSALHLADTAADVAAPARIVDAGQRVVLAQSSDAAKNGGVSAAAAYGSRLALNNDGEEIAICVGPCADGVIIDRVGWKALAAAYDGHALVFDRAAGGFCPATRPFGTAGDFGTPGDPDDACPAPDGGF